MGSIKGGIRIKSAISGQKAGRGRTSSPAVGPVKFGKVKGIGKGGLPRKSKGGLGLGVSTGGNSFSG